MKKTLLAALIMGITGAAHAEQKVVAGLLCGLAVRECRKPIHGERYSRR